MTVIVLRSDGTKDRLLVDAVDRRFEKDYYILFCFRKVENERILVAEFINPICVYFYYE